MGEGRLYHIHTAFALSFFMDNFWFLAAKLHFLWTGLPSINGALPSIFVM